MASSPLRAPAAAGQSRLMDMQKKFQEKHLATLAAIKGKVAGSTTSSTTSSTKTTGSSDMPVPPVRRVVGAIPAVQPQPRRPAGSGSGSDSVVQVDVKGKVRQLFAERSQQQQGPGYQHHQQLRRQRRRSLTGRDRSRPLRPLSGGDDDPLCKTVCFTAPSLAGGADLVGISSANGSDVRGELLALFGRLPNLGGQLLSESFRAGAGKMKTAQSAPELKWLLDGGTGPGRAGGGPARPAAQPAAAGPKDKGGGGGGPRLAGAATGAGDDGDYGDDDDDDDDGDHDGQQQQSQRPAGRINSKTAVVKKPLAAVNGNVGGGGGGGGGGVGRVAKKPTSNDSNRLLLPPVVQPTVINALAAGAGAAAALASVSAATAAGAQKPVVRAGKLPAQKPAAPRRVAPLPAKTSPRPPAVKNATPATTTTTRPQPVKQQLSADRGPPAKGMARCPLCARDFAADRLPKHEEVCRRTRERDRKRKVFDTSKKRLEAVAAEAGVDVSSFKKKSQKEDQRVAEKLQKKKDAWRRKHDQLVRNVRAARAVQRHLAAGGTVKDLPPELENAAADQDDEVDSDLVKCPHCGRTFNEASAERHIPLCADRQRNAAARMQNNKKR
ncbi:uncharacterized protein LOC114119189 [Aphis gossypii]|uniref:uncharacterized protein LOC114119189 n=1 Tax=Aphis gossypii TaxID=80765 RepID=UPI0021590266|nr:uncharacterized protein LOC114119189 [Aphis gossypii]XP_050062206.1 uncharacterized protein LOC114119189 [Aphis gossypii]XP_050062207.1 uncharacterized protein LOC114119189 [Aphis gossypii]